MSEPNRDFDDRNDPKLKRSQQPIPAASAARSSSMGERTAPARTFVEQEPAMRSMAISALSPASLQPRTVLREPALQKSAPGGLAHLRPLSVLTPQRPHLVDKAPPKSREHFRKSRRSKSESSIVWVWAVDHAALPERHDDFPLLRTSKLVLDTQSNVISTRISDVLQSRSIKAKFSKKSDGPNNVAKCRNTDFCKFTIGLYAGEEGGVLVEVHRLSGDAISFAKDCRAILAAAEGKTEDLPSNDKPLFFSLPVSEMKFARTASLPPLSLEEEADCMKVTAELLSSRLCDSNMLGMESLVAQTDPLKSVRSTAVTASKMILCPDDPQNLQFNVHNHVMSLLLYTEEDDLPVPEDSPLTALEDHSARLRNLAASALSNSLALLAEEKSLAATLSPHQEWYATVLVPKLLQDLINATRRPHDACYASRCLAALAGSSAGFAQVMKEAGGHDAAESAEEVGAREFALLMRDAAEYHNVLSCCV